MTYWEGEGQTETAVEVFRRTPRPQQSKKSFLPMKLTTFPMVGYFGSKELPVLREYPAFRNHQKGILRSEMEHRSWGRSVSGVLKRGRFHCPGRRGNDHSTLSTTEQKYFHAKNLTGILKRWRKRIGGIEVWKNQEAALHLRNVRYSRSQMQR